MVGGVGEDGFGRSRAVSESGRSGHGARGPTKWTPAEEGFGRAG